MQRAGSRRLAAVALAVCACSGRPGGFGSEAAPGGAAIAVRDAGDTCEQTAFGQQLWASVIAPRCYGCHLTGGLAQQNGSQYVLADSGTPHYIGVNLAAVRAAAARQIDGQPSILVKPTQQVAHGGGQVIAAGSPEHVALAHFISRDDLHGDCEPQVEAAALQALVLRPPVDTVRRAALQLGGRLPTATELQQAASGSPQAALGTVLQAPAFGAFIKTLYNDTFLAEGFTGDNLISFTWNVMGMPFWYNNDLYHGVVMAWPLAQNNLELVQHIALADRPYTDILQAPYRMVNPYAACGLVGAGYQLPFTQPCATQGAANNACTEQSFGMQLTDCPEFVPAAITNPRFANPPPVSGILTDPALWTVFSTTSTNRNRHRAAMLYKTFLGLDILTLGPQLSPGSSAAAGDPNAPPTVANPGCAVCHRLLDPVAGTLKNFGPTGEHTAAAPWYDDMFPPGFEGAPLPATYAGEPAAWLGAQMAADPRFAYGAVKLLFTALTGAATLPDPAANDPNYVESLRAKLTQNQFLWDQAAQFAADGFRLRGLAARLLLSPFVASTGVAPGTAAPLAAQLSAYGHALRVGPEQMDGVLRGLIGGPWNDPNASTGATLPVDVAQAAYLTGPLRVSDGGIDSKATITRNNDMSTVAAAIASFMGGNVPCVSVAADFARPPAQRRLLPLVALTTVPDGGPQSALIAGNVAYLHQLLFGEQVGPQDPEVLADVALFTQVRNNHAGSSALPPACRSGAIVDDPAQTVVAWSAVFGALLQDSRFLHQ